jgi:hypothetical protein
MAKLQTDINAREFRSVNGVGGCGRVNHGFYAGVRGRVVSSCALCGGTSFFGAVDVYEILLFKRKDLSWGHELVARVLRGKMYGVRGVGGR